MGDINFIVWYFSIVNHHDICKTIITNDVSYFFDYIEKLPKIKSSDVNTYIWKQGNKYDIDFFKL